MVSNYSLRYILSFFLVSCLFLTETTYAQELSTDAGVISKGKELFDTNCVSCHALDVKKVGPALEGVDKRRDVSWLLSFIKHPQKLGESGDKDAEALFKEYGYYMPDQAFLKDEDIIAIVSYLKSPTASAGTGGGTDTAGGGDASVIKLGQEIFETNCVSCHDIDKKKVGPALKGISERRDIDWIIKFVKAPQKTIESGDEYAVALYDEFKSSGFMPNHNFLKDDDIKAVVEYIKNPPVKAKTETVVAEGEKEEESVSKSLLISIIVGVVVLLLFILFVLTSLSSKLTKSLKKEGVDAGSGIFNIKAIFANKTVQAVIGFVFFALISKAALAGLFSIGVQQGYAPDQPIPFSHKLHAGEYEIDCKYCHTGALRGKNSGIPSASICMNCHNTIKNTSPEIQKIYKAIETDTPIQWVRVHNLPDLAYFNHSQHVVVAGLECQTCHGPIQEMEVVQHFSKLTMGWCIDCHRKTDVNTKGNEYYDNLVKLHKETSKEPLNVEDIGGLECSKCHY